MAISIRTETCDLHRLALSFAAVRVRNNQAAEALATSIGRSGQLTPVVAVSQPADRLTLIDGYLRIEALQLLGRDTCLVDVWDCEVSKALLLTLARAQARHWEAIAERGQIFAFLFMQKGVKSLHFYLCVLWFLLGSSVTHRISWCLVPCDESWCRASGHL